MVWSLRGRDPFQGGPRENPVMQTPKNPSQCMTKQRQCSSGCPLPHKAGPSAAVARLTSHRLGSARYGGCGCGTGPILRLGQPGGRCSRSSGAEDIGPGERSLIASCDRVLIWTQHRGLA
ncbi:hypothetical protein NDU88_005153 [Pleurodeles waltl]|uniref:Uncharacterized protein n=1 Tax=Pleurodeles waltl TaxID=8319 RepID=A0AAV7SKV8_PLEWA|nr:hypothetical protein NDU88_005153 [Pleurodeles waltl]